MYPGKLYQTQTSWNDSPQRARHFFSSMHPWFTTAATAAWLTIHTSSECFVIFSLTSLFFYNSYLDTTAHLLNWTHMRGKHSVHMSLSYLSASIVSLLYLPPANFGHLGNRIFPSLYLCLLFIVFGQQSFNSWYTPSWLLCRDQSTHVMIPWNEVTHLKERGNKGGQEGRSEEEEVERGWREGWSKNWSREQARKR